MCRYIVKKLDFVIKYVPDWLVSVPDCYKNKKCVIKQLINTLMH